VVIVRSAGFGAAHEATLLCSCFYKWESLGFNTEMQKSPRTILIVDDDENIVELLVCVLEATGFKTVNARAGGEAVALARLHGPALIVCDMKMPGMTGLDVLRQLRDKPETATIPFMLMSGAMYPESDLQPSAYLSKPFHPQDLVNAVRQLIAPSSEIAA
jgi:twitching motility two-component system response regulator PilH